MIDRNKLLNEIIDLLAKDCKDMELCGKIVGLISVQPTVQERPKGRWLRCENDLYCSNCKRDAMIRKGLPFQSWSNFCPNCGADMRESE